MNQNSIGAIIIDIIKFNINRPEKKNKLIRMIAIRSFQSYLFLYLPIIYFPTTTFACLMTLSFRV